MEPKAYLGSATGRNRDLVPPTRLGATLVWIDRLRSTDHMVVDPVLGELGERIGSEQPRIVGFVVAEQGKRTDTVRRWCGIQAVARQSGVINSDAVMISPGSEMTRIPRVLIVM
jgi:hypothetical protein